MANLPHLSHSSLDDLRTCGEKLRLRKVEKVPQRPGWALIGGNAVHSVTEAIDKRDFGMPINDVDLDFGCVFNGYITQELDRSPEFQTSDYYSSGRKSKEWPDKENERWWRLNGPLMVERWKTFKRVTNWEVWLTPQGEPAIELALLGEYGGAVVKGYLDRVMQLPSGDLAVLDVKTGANEPKSATQLGLYADMVAKLFGEKYRPRWGTYWMGRTGSLTPPVDLAPLAKDLDEDYRKARLIIEQDLFLASPGMLCGSCSVNAYCRSFSGQAVLPLPSSTC